MLRIEKKTLLYKENTFHYKSRVSYFFNCRWTVLTVISIKVPWPANRCCCKTLWAEGFIIRRLGRNAVRVDGLVRLWGNCPHMDDEFFMSTFELKIKVWHVWPVYTQFQIFFGIGLNYHKNWLIYKYTRKINKIYLKRVVGLIFR